MNEGRGANRLLDRLLDLSTRRDAPRRVSSGHGWPGRSARPALARHLAALTPDPDPLRIVKIAGTNGKGSTAAILAACLQAAGRRVGLFTSPHLVRVSERVRIDGQEVAPSVLADHLDTLAPRLRRDPVRFFEGMVLLALTAFRAAGVEIALFEAGIGGGGDATALLPGELALLTTVGRDHEAMLGSTLEAIAAEKAGIASAGSTLVLGPGIDPALQVVIGRVAASRGARVLPAEASAVRAGPPESWGTPVTIDLGMCRTDLRLPLLGAFQVDNLRTSIAALRVAQALGWVEDLACVAATEGAVWPGRCEHVPPNWLLDGAHNAAGIEALIVALDAHLPGRPRQLLFGVARGKDYASWVAQLGAVASRVYLVGGFYRAEEPAVLARALPPTLTVGEHFATPAAAVAGLKTTPPTDLLVAAGSLFLVGAVRAQLRGES